MVGIPDGLGAYDNGDGTFTVLMNRELGDTLGIASRTWRKRCIRLRMGVRQDDAEVKSGNDLIQNVFTYDAISGSYVEHNAALGNGVAFNRFCSADLADQSAFYNSATGLGYNGGRLFQRRGIRRRRPRVRAYCQRRAGRQFL